MYCTLGKEKCQRQGLEAFLTLCHFPVTANISVGVQQATMGQLGLPLPAPGIRTAIPKARVSTHLDPQVQEREWLEIWCLGQWSTGSVATLREGSHGRVPV